MLSRCGSFSLVLLRFLPEYVFCLYNDSSVSSIFATEPVALPLRVACKGTWDHQEGAGEWGMVELEITKLSKSCLVARQNIILTHLRVRRILFDKFPPTEVTRPCPFLSFFAFANGAIVETFLASVEGFPLEPSKSPSTSSKLLFVMFTTSESTFCI